MTIAPPNENAESTCALAVDTSEDSKWPRAAKTHDGVDYKIRPIRADDPERHRLFTASPESSLRYDRMMGLMPKASANLLNRLVHVAYRHEMAIAAVVGQGGNESIVAVACYCGNPAYCEFALAVADEWQSRGIGTALSELLFSHAKANGVRRVYTTLLAASGPMLNLANSLRMSIRRTVGDGTVVEAWRSL
jgi:acetyltransferase